MNLELVVIHFIKRKYLNIFSNSLFNSHEFSDQYQNIQYSLEKCKRNKK